MIIYIEMDIATSFCSNSIIEELKSLKEHKTTVIFIFLIYYY